MAHEHAHLQGGVEQGEARLGRRGSWGGKGGEERSMEGVGWKENQARGSGQP